MTQQHVHDCTGPDQRCECGFVFRVPPIGLNLEVWSGKDTLVSEMFNTNSISAVISTLREVIDRLEAIE